MATLNHTDTTEPTMPTPLRVLFICDGNAARSQMAAGLLRHLGGSDFEVHSAGLEAAAPQPQAIAALQEIGIDIAGLPTPHIDDYEAMQFDYVITLCEETKESCLAFPRDHANLHWECADPADVSGPTAAVTAAYRQVRDQLRRQIEQWLPTVRRAGA
ncbi:arsenate reductase ArsC [Sulfurivermis fontis]|uniref:arsenate reductase ArsC n=1 Tax=Sulfurivermis fontis TaxID=1972068 RepID=UPI0018D51A6B|nr:arsenate reductase ArsC [Sulfurivermis fontis]